jgi:hypothetical protein
MFVVFVVGVIFFLAARGGRSLGEHMRDDAPAASPVAAGASREQ